MSLGNWEKKMKKKECYHLIDLIFFVFGRLLPEDQRYLLDEFIANIFTNNRVSDKQNQSIFL